jgi:hypothetical protein
MAGAGQDSGLAVIANVKRRRYVMTGPKANAANSKIVGKSGEP